MTMINIINQHNKAVTHFVKFIILHINIHMAHRPLINFIVNQLKRFINNPQTYIFQ